MKNLVKIDLSDVNIVSGGDDYWFTAVETGVEIEDNVFPMGFFEHLKYLEEIKLPNSIVEIERKAFYKLKNRISIDIPNGVTTIGYDAFYKFKLFLLQSYPPAYSLCCIIITDSITIFI